MAGLRCSHLLCLAVLAVGVRAEEKATPAAPPTEDAISAARRDFDAIKSSRAPAASQRLELPIATPPPVHALPDDLTAYREAQAAENKQGMETTDRGKRSSNWLVDAMSEKTEKRRDAWGHETFAAGETGAEHTLSSDGRGETRAERNASVGGAPRSANVDNPLTRYMAGWMTTRDFELLKERSTDGGLATGSDRSHESAPAAFGLEGLMPVGPAGSGLRPGAPLMSPDPKPNPYLADLAGGVGQAAPANDNLQNLPAPNGLSPVAPASVAPLPKDEIAPVRNVAPPNELLKPANDEKYFRQLKRF